MYTTQRVDVTCDYRKEKISTYLLIAGRKQTPQHVAYAKKEENTNLCKCV